MGRVLRRHVRTMLGCDVDARATSSLDRLEERTLLSTSPLPTLSQLEDENNSVVRFETNFGEFDIELFNSVVPETVSNFLNYVRSGRFSETFFHRSVRLGSQGAQIDVLQGGGFAYSNDAGYSSIDTDAPIVLQYNRPNIERTLSMARTNQINSATSQFFINTVDNTAPLGPGGVDPNGYAVFGRVIQGWDNVLAIRNLSITDLSQDAAFAGTQTLFSSVPTTSSYNTSSGVRENALATIINTEVVKAAEVPGFFTIEQVAPEGWRSEFTTETVDLYNPNNVAARYQLIAHYEVSGKNTSFETGARDRVIAEGTLTGNTRSQIRISVRGEAGFVSPVRAEEGYSLVLKTAFAENVTDELPLTADITRNDFNASTGEAFINLTALSTQQKREWAFPRIERNPLSKEFLTFWNPNSTDTAVTIDFVTPEGPRTFNLVLNAYRRGGFAVDEQALAEGFLSARIRSTQDIGVSLTDWDLAAEGENVSRTSLPGYLVNGFAGGGAIVGGIAQVLGSTDGKGEVALYNPTATSTSVNLTIYRNDGTSTNQSVTLLARSRASVDVGFGLSDGQPATVLYNSGTVPIAAQYTWIPTANRNVASDSRVDGASTMFDTNIASGTIFAGTFDPTNGTNGFRETVSIFNPFSSDTTNVRVEYLFSDGVRIVASSAAILPRTRVEISTQNQQQVLTKIGSGAQFRSYSIIVSGLSAPTGVEGVTPGLVGFFRDDTRLARTVLSNGSAINTLLQLSSPDTIGAAPGTSG
mgnify:CR=1 FL=1